MEATMALLKEEERTCRELEITNGIHRSISNQARILCIQGDFDKGDLEKSDRYLERAERIDQDHISEMTAKAFKYALQGSIVKAISHNKNISYEEQYYLFK